MTTRCDYNPNVLPGIALTVVALAVLLYGEGRNIRPLTWIAKLLASTGFLVVAFAAGALTSRYGTIVVAALILSFIGDALLIPQSRGAFRVGLLAFLFAHVAFAAAFVVRDVVAGPTIVALAILAAVGVVVYRWLLPHLSQAMRIAVPAYIVSIVVMAALAIGTALHFSGLIIAVGAIAFAVSDLAVARDRFVARSFMNRLWGLPLYYAAQILLALSVRA